MKLLPRCQRHLKTANSRRHQWAGGWADLSKVECPFKSSMLRNRKYHFGNRSPTSALDYSSQIIRSTEIWDRTRVCDRTKGIRSTLHGPSQISAPSRHCKRIRMRKLTVNLRIVDSFARFGQRSSTPMMTRYPRARKESDRKNCTKAAAPPPKTASTTRE